MLLFNLVLLLAGTALCEAGCGRRVCYHTNWSQYRHGPGKFVPEDIDPHLCTHIIYSFAKLTNDHLVAFEWNDESTAWSTGMYERFTDLKKITPDVKLIIAVGGWNMGSSPFTHMVASSATRKDFIDDTVKFLRAHKFDGLDLDWEYPGNRGSPASDRHKFTLLIQELQAAFQQESATSGKPKLLLSAAVAAGKDKIETAYEVQAMATALDFVSLMSYDLHGSWEATAGHNSPLYGSGTETGIEALYNMDSAVQYYLDHGCPPEKLNLGLATYGRNFQLTDASQHDVYSPIRGAGPAGRYTGEKGFNAYYEICDKINSGAKVYRIPKQQVPYAVLGTDWIGFDDEQSLRNKVDYALDRGLGGVMFWAIDLDDFKGTSCGKGPYPLMTAVKEECASRTDGGTFKPTDASLTTAGHTPGPQTTPTAHVTSGPTSDTPTDTPTPARSTDSPATTPADVTATTSTTAPPPTTTTTTKKPIIHHVNHTKLHKCDPDQDDFHPNPHDCASYFICTKGLAYHVTCAQGLTFNAATKFCDWPDNHDCKLPAGASTMHPTTTTTTRPTTTTTTTTKPTTPAVQNIDIMSICQDQSLSDGIHPDPTDCKHFVECYNSMTSRLICPPGTAFSVDLGNCDFIGHIKGCQ